MGQFKVQQRTKDGFFNATELLKQWNIALDKVLTIAEFIEFYIPAILRPTVVDKCGNGVYLPISFESQLRLFVADYDFELYDKLMPSIISWELNLPIAHIADGDSIAKPKLQMTYLIQDNISGATKIGRSFDPHLRERTLGAQIPQIKLLAICPSDVEYELHERYKAKRMRGEWFNLTPKDIRRIIKEYGFNYVK